jgi:hypothetical protein
MPVVKEVVVIISVAAAPTVMLSGCVVDCAGVLASVTLMVKADGPAGPVGVPVMAPVLLVRLSPAGNIPALTLNDSGANPVAWMVWLYGDPSTAAGREVVVIAGGTATPTVMLNGCVTDCAGVLPSVTLIVKDDGPVGPVGVPVMAPVLLVRLSPAGNVPTLTLNDSGANPAAWMVWLYGDPCVAAGREVVVIVGGPGLIRIVSAWVTDTGPTVLESVIFTVKVAVPVVPVGVPVIAPVLVFRLKPVGSAPLMIEYVSVPAPPVPTGWLYAAPIVPAGNVAVLSAGAGVIEMFTVALFVGSATEVAVTLPVSRAPLVGAE